MRIGILSRNPALYSTRRLQQTARLRGHDVTIIDTMAVAIEVGLPARQSADIKTVIPKPTSGIHAIEHLPPIDAVIPRIGTSITQYGLAVVRQFEARGVLTTATAEAISRSRDKLHSLQLMSQAGLPIPKTAVVTQPEALFSAIAAVGGLPVVIKLVRGTQGRGTILASNYSTVAAVLAKLRELNKQALVQEFIAEAKAKDVRIIVVGNRCVAAMERTAAMGEFRANLHLGGTAVPVVLPAATEKLALAAAKAHGLSLAGVDIIQSARGPLLLEVNSSPGLEGIEQATQVNVAAEVITFLEQSARQQKRRPRPRQKERR